jgi:biopolymer transport protein ExbD
MKLKRQSRFHHEVATGALNDIMFFLLLFFLIAATVANPQVIKLALPSSNAADGGGASKPVYLTVDKDRQFYVGSDPTPIAWAQVEPALSSAIQGIEEPVVVLRVEKELDVQSLVDVLDLGMRLQVKMVLQTSTK